MKAVNEKSTAYIVLAITSGFLFYKYLMQVYPSVMTHTLMSHFHLNGAGLGNLAAAFFYAYMITQIFVGYLLDRFSLRLFCTAAIFISASGLFVFAWTNLYSIAFLGRFLMGVGAAFATVCYMKCTSVWFEPKHYPFISSLLATSTMLGAAFGSAPLAYVVNSFGWRGSVMLLAAIGAILGFLFMVFVKDRQSFDHQQESYSVSFADIKKILTNKQNWLITFYSGLSFSPVAVFGGLWGNPFLQEKFHYSYTTSATLISMIFIGLALGGPMFAYLSSRLGRRKPFMVFANAMALSCVTAVIYGSSHLPYWVVFSLLLLFGVGVGCFMLGFVIGKERNAIALTASVIALINAGDALFGAFTEPMIGKFLDMSHTALKQGGAVIFQLHDYHIAFLVLPLYLFIATSLLFFIRTEKYSMAADGVSLPVAAMVA